jgi:hypothetical protein
MTVPALDAFASRGACPSAARENLASGFLVHPIMRFLHPGRLAAIVRFSRKRYALSPLRDDPRGRGSRAWEEQMKRVHRSPTILMASLLVMMPALLGASLSSAAPSDRAAGSSGSSAAVSPGAASPSATIVATVPYLLTATTQCTGVGQIAYRATFPLITANRRLDIKFVSCFETAGPTPPFSLGIAFLGIDDALALPHHSLPWATRVAFGQPIGEIYESTDLTIEAGHRASIAYAAAGNLLTHQCTISGELQFLQ